MIERQIQMEGPISMWHRNKLTETLGIRYPILQAGMAGVSTPELVAAVSNACGLGILGAGYMNPEECRDQIKRIQQRTDQPFGVNLFIPEETDVSGESMEKAQHWLEAIRKDLGLKRSPVNIPPPSHFEEKLEIIREERVPVCSFTFGLPTGKTVQKLKKENVILIGTATTVEEAKAVEEMGMDMVVVQGFEAGGHRGTFNQPFEKAMVGTLALVPQVVDQVNIPVIAAGGIMDGRGVLAALILGAQGVQMGTAFIPSAESGAHPLYKQAILESTEVDPVITSAFSGKPARAIENRFIREMRRYEDRLPPYPYQHHATTDIRQEAAKRNQTACMALWSGQGPRLSQAKSAGELLAETVQQVDRILNDLSRPTR